MNAAEKALQMEEAELLTFFDFDHLPKPLQAVSEQYHGLAHAMTRHGRPTCERVAGLRKLLESKDCMVRAEILARGERPA